MRKTKFRLIKNDKIVGYEKHCLTGNVGVRIYHSVVNDDCEDFEWISITYSKSGYIDHNDKEQYTGLKDKNGKDIYEGDILTGFELNGTYSNYTVEFISGCFCYKQIGCEGFCEPLNCTARSLIEIIGNIHED